RKHDTPFATLIGLKLNAPSSVPGAPLAPSVCQNRILGRAVTEAAFKLATQKSASVIARPALPGTGVTSSANMRAIVFPAGLVAPPAAYPWPVKFTVLSYGSPATEPEPVVGCPSAW